MRRFFTIPKENCFDYQILVKRQWIRNNFIFVFIFSNFEYFETFPKSKVFRKDRRIDQSISYLLFSHLDIREQQHSAHCTTRCLSSFTRDVFKCPKISQKNVSQAEKLISQTIPYAQSKYNFRCDIHAPDFPKNWWTTPINKAS